MINFENKVAKICKQILRKEALRKDFPIYKIY